MIHAVSKGGGILLYGQNAGGDKVLAKTFGLKLPESEMISNYAVMTTVELNVLITGAGTHRVRLLVYPVRPEAGVEKCRDCDGKPRLVARQSLASSLMYYECPKCHWMTAFPTTDTDRRETCGFLVGEHSSRRVWFDGGELLPDKSQEVCNHSPDGFAWGYPGSGPAQLALAVSLRLCPSKKDAVLVYQAFKTYWLAKLDKDRDFCVPIVGIQGWLDLAIQKARRGEPI